MTVCTPQADRRSRGQLVMTCSVSGQRGGKCMRNSTAHRTCWFVVAGGLFSRQKAGRLSVRLATGKWMEGHGPTTIRKSLKVRNPTSNSIVEVTSPYQLKVLWVSHKYSFLFLSSNECMRRAESQNNHKYKYKVNVWSIK